MNYMCTLQLGLCRSSSESGTLSVQTSLSVRRVSSN